MPREASFPREANPFNNGFDMNRVFGGIQRGSWRMFQKQAVYGTHTSIAEGEEMKNGDLVFKLREKGGRHPSGSVGQWSWHGVVPVSFEQCLL